MGMNPSLGACAPGSSLLDNISGTSSLDSIPLPHRTMNN
jgi:hypothetical protein